MAQGSTDGRLHHAWAHHILLPRLLRGLDRLSPLDRGLEDWDMLRADLQDELNTDRAVARAFDNPELLVAMAMHLASDTVGQGPDAEHRLPAGSWAPTVASLLERATDLAAAQRRPAVPLHDQVLDISARAMRITMDGPVSTAVGAAIGRAGFHAIAAAADRDATAAGANASGGHPTALEVHRTLVRASLRLRGFREGSLHVDDTASRALAVALMDAVEGAVQGDPGVPTLERREQLMLLSLLTDMGRGSAVAARAHLLRAQVVGDRDPRYDDHLRLAASLELIPEYGRHRTRVADQAWRLLPRRVEHHLAAGDPTAAVKLLGGTDPARGIPQLLHIARALQERGDLPGAAAALVAEPALVGVIADRSVPDTADAQRLRGGVTALEVRRLWQELVAAGLQQGPDVALEVVRLLPAATAAAPVDLRKDSGDVRGGDVRTASGDLRQPLLETIAERAATGTTLPPEKRVATFVGAVEVMQSVDVRSGLFIVALAENLSRQPHGGEAVAAAGRLVEQIGARIDAAETSTPGRGAGMRGTPAAGAAPSHRRGGELA